MNRKRRSSLTNALDLIRRAQDIVTLALDEEQDAFDNLPEGIADGERGAFIEACADHLDTAVESLENAMQEITEAIS